MLRQIALRQQVKEICIFLQYSLEDLTVICSVAVIDQVLPQVSSTCHLHKCPKCWNNYCKNLSEESQFVGGCIFCVWIDLRWVLGFVFLGAERLPGKVSSHQARKKHQNDAQGTHDLSPQNWLTSEMLEYQYHKSKPVKQWNVRLPPPQTKPVKQYEIKCPPESLNIEQCQKRSIGRGIDIGTEIMEHTESTHSTRWIIHSFDLFIHRCLPVMDSSFTLNWFA